MSERLREEKSPAPENLEDQRFKELKDAMDEQGRLMEEIIIARGTETQEGVRARVGPLLNEASEKTKGAMQEWLNLRKVSDERKELGD
ncbi:MAG: hypothetical protein Q7S66_06095 [bacterium]|nr:hypothetical protein [bacterium]